MTKHGFQNKNFCPNFGEQGPNLDFEVFGKLFNVAYFTGRPDFEMTIGGPVAEKI